MIRIISPQRCRERRDNAEVLPSLRNPRALCASAVKFLFASLLALLCSTLAAGQTTTSKAIVSEDGSQLSLGNRILLKNTTDGFMSVKQIRPAPDGKHFAVIACGYECNDNIGFLFNADGTGKRNFTALWDFILQDKVEWSADGKRLFYFRIHSTGAEAPANVPAESQLEGWIEVNVTTGRKSKAVSRTLKTLIPYNVFNVAPNDSLNVREAPNGKAEIIGKLAHNANGIHVTQERRVAGQITWVKIKHDMLVGWVNQNYLYEQPISSKQQ